MGRRGVEVDDGALGTVDQYDNLVLVKDHVRVVIGVLSPFLDASDYVGEALNWLAEQSGPAVQGGLGAVMSERSVYGRPFILVSRRLSPCDEVCVAGRQCVEHCVVCGAGGASQCFLGRVAACCQQAASADEFYPVHGAPSWSMSL